MKLIRNLMAAVLMPLALLTFICPPIARAGLIGPAIGAAGVVQSPTSVSANITSAGIVCSLVKPEAGIWTVTISNFTGATGAGTIVIQELLADNVTWLTVTVFNNVAGTAFTIGTAGVITVAAATLQTLVYQFSGPIVGLRVNALTLTAGTISGSISAN